MIRKVGLFCPDLIRDLAASENRLDILELMKGCLFEDGELADEAIRILVWMAPWGSGELDYVALNRMIEFAGSDLADPDIGPLMLQALSRSIVYLHNINDLDCANAERVLEDLKDAMRELMSRPDVEIEALIVEWNNLMNVLASSP
jgi:hypothetical protein